MRSVRIGSALLPLALVLSIATAVPYADAASHASSTPKKLGDFNDWTAATYAQSGHTMCYAFTRAKQATPAQSDHHPAILTITERPTMRDSVAIEAGFDFAPNTAVKVEVGHTSLDFYAAHRNAYARDNKAAVIAFEQGAEAVAHLPVPHGKAVAATFSLNGFSAAHDAILKACPGK